MNSLFAFGGGPYDWIIIAGVVFLLFGSRLPNVMRDLGRGVTEFKKGMNGIDDHSHDDEDEDVAPKAKKKIDTVVEQDEDVAPKIKSS